jgi:hypothetical protein
MKATTYRAERFISNPWFTVVLALISLSVTIWGVISPNTASHPVFFSTIIFVGIFLIVVIGYSLNVQLENKVFHSLSQTFYDITIRYRGQFQKLTNDKNPTIDPSKIPEIQKDLLTYACERIQIIFTSLINRQCTVTIKVIKNEREREKYFAETYVRSPRSKRDDKLLRGEVGTGGNTSFDEALRGRLDESPLHFFSADLTKLKNYKNERHNFVRYYRSTLIVPISVSSESEKNIAVNDCNLFGFLCVDTKSVNRLNEEYHLLMLASLAYQMFNFMSRMKAIYNDNNPAAAANNPYAWIDHT